MPLLPKSLLGTNVFMNFYRRNVTSQYPGYATDFPVEESIASDINGNCNEPFSWFRMCPIDLGVWSLIFFICCFALWMVQSQGRRGGMLARKKADATTTTQVSSTLTLARVSPNDSEPYPFDPYLRSTNTPLDASFIASTSPSYKHTDVPSRIYASRKSNHDVDLNDKLEGMKEVRPRSRSGVGLGLGLNLEFPEAIWDSSSSIFSTSTPNRRWDKTPAEGSGLLSHPFHEDSPTLIEKESTREEGGKGT